MVHAATGFFSRFNVWEFRDICKSEFNLSKHKHCFDPSLVKVQSLFLCDFTTLPLTSDLILLEMKFCSSQSDRHNTK